MKSDPLSILFPWQSEVVYRELPESVWHDLGLDAFTEKVARFPQEAPLIRRVMTSLTDDPARTGNPLVQLAAGTPVTYLTTMYNSGAWDYIETTINGQVARGFVPAGTLSIDDTDEFAAVDAAEQMDEDEGL